MGPLCLLFKASDWHWTGSGDSHPDLDPTLHFFFIETVSPSEMEVTLFPTSSMNAGREGKTLNIVCTQIMFILL